MTQFRCALWIAAVWIGLFTSGSFAQRDKEFVDATCWSSPDGRWTLAMEPSDKGGAGPAQYRMAHAGQETWAAKLDWTLREARVGDTGHVVGYAYDNGHLGWSGNMIAVVLGPDGKTLAADARKRSGMSWAIDPPPPGEPRGNGILLDEEADRGIVRAFVETSGGRPSAWWIYRLSDGTHLRDFKPRPPESGDAGFSREIDAELVPWTGLILVHWYAFRRGSARFELIDRDDKVVWSDEIKKEYAGMGDRWNWWDLFEKDVHQIEVSPRAFALTSYSLKERVHYTIEPKEGGGWSVTELRREPGSPGSAKVAFVWDPEPIEAKKLGEITLGTQPDRSPISGIPNLSIDGRGRIGWVRSDREAPDRNASRFVLVDAAGQAVVNLPIEQPAGHEDASVGQAIWLEGDRWLAVRGWHDANSQAQADAFFLDALTGKLTAIPDFKSGWVRQLCRTPDGGFVALCQLSGNYTIRDQVSRYDPDGKLVSSKTEPGYGQGDLYKDICVLDDGSVAALIAVPDIVKIYRLGAAAPEVINVSDLIGGGFIYPGDIRADKDGGFIIHETHDGPKLYRVNKDRKVWQTLEVRGPQGETFRLYDQFAVAPDGSVWCSDHNRLFRLGPDGKADLALGGPVEGSVGELVAITLDKEGAIYAVENGTAYVHVFEPDGKPRRVLKPLPTDLSTQDDLSLIGVDGDGTVRYRMSWEGPIMVFAPDGSRIGPEPKEEPDYSKPVEFRKVSGSGGLWRHDGEKIRRMNVDGTVAAEIAYRPSGPWLRRIVETDAAPDGALAVVCEERSMGDFGLGPAADGPWLCLYAPDGKGIAECRIGNVSPFTSLHLRTGHVLLCSEESVTVVPIPFARPRKWTIPGKEGDFWRVLIDPKTGDWLTWASGSHTIQRWEQVR